MLLCFLLKRASGHLNSKGFRRNMFLMTRATQKERATTSLKTNLERNRVSTEKGFCQSWDILTCVSQNIDEEKSKLVAVKIVQTYTQLMKKQP